MQIICISRGSFGYGKQLAEKLAAKLGYDCVSREELTDRATDHGIPVGKLEAAIIKRQPLSEALAIEVDRLQAFITAELCERATKNGVVYHGRTGHLILPGISNVLRIRAIADMEERIDMTMQRMNLTRDKAKQYNEQVDEDRRRWVRTLYNVDWEDPSHYDITINSSHMSLENSATALVQMAQLPDFQETPASRIALRDILLTARCRLAIGKDERTHEVKVSVRADKGNVSVTYLPRQAKQAEAIPEVLKEVDGVQSIICTVATTNILYIQEKFDDKSEAMNHVIEVAEKWNAAVELIRLADVSEKPVNGTAEESISELGTASRAENGGILDDTPEVEAETGETYGLPEALNRLVQTGRAGTTNTVYGGPKQLMKSLSRTENYSLIVIGDVYLAKGDAVKKRMKRDLIGSLNDHLHIPVISTDDLKSQYLFGAKQLAETAIYAGIAAMFYTLIFTNQEAILGFLTKEGTAHRMLAAALVVIFVPIGAYIYGSFTHNILKLIKME